MKKLEEINCGSAITADDVNQLIVKNYHDGDDTDRKLIQDARQTIHQESDFVWKDAEFAITGHNVNVILYAGSRSNKFVAHLNKDDDITTFCSKAGFRKMMSDSTCYVWELLKSAAKNVADNATMALASGLGAAIAFIIQKRIGYK